MREARETLATLHGPMPDQKDGRGNHRLRHRQQIFQNIPHGLRRQQFRFADYRMATRLDTRKGIIDEPL